MKEHFLIRCLPKHSSPYSFQLSSDVDPYQKEIDRVDSEESGKCYGCIPKQVGHVKRWLKVYVGRSI